MKNFGLLAILLFWVLAVCMIIKAKHEHGASISEHVAKSRSTRLIFGACVAIIMVLFGSFMVGWFIPHFQLGSLYALIILIGVSATFIAAAIPATTGLRRTIHDSAAYSMALTLLLSSLVLVFSVHITTIARLTVGISIFGMTVLSVVFAITRKFHEQQRKLLLQVAYYVLFHISILVTVYFAS